LTYRLILSGAGSWKSAGSPYRRRDIGTGLSSITQIEMENFV
jgi:hypothetical protein